MLNKLTPCKGRLMKKTRERIAHFHSPTSSMGMRLMGFLDTAFSGLEIGVTHRLFIRSEEDWGAVVEAEVDVVRSFGALAASVTDFPLAASTNFTVLLSAVFSGFSVGDFFFSNPRRSINFFTFTNS